MYKVWIGLWETNKKCKGSIKLAAKEQLVSYIWRDKGREQKPEPIERSRAGEEEIPRGAKASAKEYSHCQPIVQQDRGQGNKIHWTHSTPIF